MAAAFMDWLPFYDRNLYMYIMSWYIFVRYHTDATAVNPGHCIVPAGVAYRNAGLYDRRLGARPLRMVYKPEIIQAIP